MPKSSSTAAPRAGHQFPNSLPPPRAGGEPEACAALLDSLVGELHPYGPRETPGEQLTRVETFAVAHWRLQFIIHDEVDTYVFCKPGSDNPALLEPRDSVRLNALVRYEAHLDRQASRALKDLRASQLDRIYGGPEGAPRCNPSAERCQIVRDIHAADKARAEAMKELENTRRAYTPPPFNPNDFVSNEANPSPSFACPTAGRVVAMPSERPFTAVVSTAAGDQAGQSLPNGANFVPALAKRVDAAASAPRSSFPVPGDMPALPNEANSLPSASRGGQSAKADLVTVGAVSTAGGGPAGSSLPNEPNLPPRALSNSSGRATAGGPYGGTALLPFPNGNSLPNEAKASPLGFLAICKRNLSNESAIRPASPQPMKMPNEANFARALAKRVDPPASGAGPRLFSRQPNPSPSSASPTAGRPISTQLSETRLDAAASAPRSCPLTTAETVSLPNEPNSCPLGFLAICNPNSLPNKPNSRSSFPFPLEPALSEGKGARRLGLKCRTNRPLGQLRPNR